MDPWAELAVPNIEHGDNASTDLDKPQDGDWDKFQSDCSITQTSQGICKSGRRVCVEEGYALQYARTLDIPVPAVIDLTTTSEGTAIVMELIPGDTLENTWKTMTSEERKNIALQLRDIITTMRQSKPDKVSIGAINGPARECRRISEYQGGPFEREAEFNEFVLDFMHGTPEFLRRNLREAWTDNSAIVFTHGDLAPRNIMVKDGRVQGIIDWEYAGWYPEYWEFVKFFDRHTTCKGWKDYAEIIFETTYPRQLLLHQAVLYWQNP